MNENLHSTSSINIFALNPNLPNSGNHYVQLFICIVKSVSKSLDQKFKLLILFQELDREEHLDVMSWIELFEYFNPRACHNSNYWSEPPTPSKSENLSWTNDDWRHWIFGIEICKLQLEERRLAWEDHSYVFGSFRPRQMHSALKLEK